MVAYIDEHRGRFGVEPICNVLSAAECKIAPSTYYAAKSRAPSPRRLRHDALMPVLLALWVANYRVYGGPQVVAGGAAGGA